MIDVIIYIWDTIVIRSEEKKLKMMFLFHYLQFSMLVHGPITGVFHTRRLYRLYIVEQSEEASRESLVPEGRVRYDVDTINLQRILLRNCRSSVVRFSTNFLVLF